MRDVPSGVTVLDTYRTTCGAIASLRLAAEEVSQVLQEVCVDCLQRDWTPEQVSNLVLFVKDHVLPFGERDALVVKLWLALPPERRRLNIELVGRSPLVQSVLPEVVNRHFNDEAFWKSFGAPVFGWLPNPQRLVR